MRWFWSIILVLVAAPVFAAHPRAIMTTDAITRIRAKETAGTADWLALKGAAGTLGLSCDRISQTTAGTGDSLPPVYAAREPVTSNPPGYIDEGYQGFNYFAASMNLMTCY